ncbi:hypothetical protein GGX14DRAFT_396249 [Mycena pura]|uniref:Uncharacterized protein n=1 Tax=Mycena pura TaxID=153505 RepID=A0AAD6VAI0_9AGAR|nr:hypothetical protein GGX14DRAFT_396249 [Mycena pura]
MVIGLASAELDCTNVKCSDATVTPTNSAGEIQGHCPGPPLRSSIHEKTQRVPRQRRNLTHQTIVRKKQPIKNHAKLQLTQCFPRNWYGIVRALSRTIARKIDVFALGGKKRTTMAQPRVERELIRNFWRCALRYRAVFHQLKVRYESDMSLQLRVGRGTPGNALYPALKMQSDDPWGDSSRTAAWRKWKRAGPSLVWISRANQSP